MAEKETLGILVPTDKHIDHLIGVAGAAKKAGKALHIFFTHDGVLMTQNPKFQELANQLTINTLLPAETVNGIVYDRRYGYEEALIEAGCLRLRAVLLTSLTTIAGLTPLLFETSLQAQFLIPMAVSLAFGVLFATVITLILVPSLYMILEDIKGKIFPGLGE